MTRITKHIALLALTAFTVSTVGVPVAINYCTMQKAYSARPACCVCPSPAEASGPALRALPCIERTDLGAPLATAFTAQPPRHAPAFFSVVALLPSVAPSPVVAARFISDAHARDGTPPPLLRTSVLLI